MPHYEVLLDLRLGREARHAHVGHPVELLLRLVDVLFDVRLFMLDALQDYGQVSDTKGLPDRFLFSKFAMLRYELWWYNESNSLISSSISSQHEAVVG